MSNEWDDGNEGLPGEQPGESDGMKNLRAAFDRQKKQNEEYKAKLAALESRERERSLSEVLSSKGLNPKLAAFYPANGEVSEEKVVAWLNEYADVFGHTAVTPTQPAPSVPPELMEQFRQFQQPGSDAPGQSQIDKIRNFQITDEASYQAFIAMMRENPGMAQNRG